MSAVRRGGEVIPQCGRGGAGTLRGRCPVGGGEAVNKRGGEVPKLPQTFLKDHSMLNKHIILIMVH